jgi:uracil phosphoribosyltransferase
MSNRFKNCTVLDHPVLQHKLAILRDEKTSSLTFRLIVEEISQFLAYSATSKLKTKKKRVRTPMGEFTNCEIIDDQLLLVPIFRAGIGMLNGMMRILPFAGVGHVGIYRDKNVKSTVEYYFRLPKNSEGKKVLILDPLLATGDTICSAIDRLKDVGVGPISLVCLLAAPEGIKKLMEYHPDVHVYALSIEKGLDKNGYILPGLGDAGDRLYNATHWS